MAQPTDNINNIAISTPAAATTPTGSDVNYFFNSLDSNKLYYKDAAGLWYIVTSSQLSCDPCLCAQAAKTICSWDQGLLDGTLTSTTYLDLVTAGITFTCSNGVDTQTLTIGTGAPVSDTIFNLQVFANDAAAGVGGLVTGQLWQDSGGIVHVKQ